MDQVGADVGRRGEELAARHLVGAGMQLLDRNWRCRAGEVDLVVRDGPTVVFVEVRTRRSMRHGGPLESVTAGKQVRMARVAQSWLARHGPFRGPIRMDVLGLLERPGQVIRIAHVQGVAAPRREPAPTWGLAWDSPGPAGAERADAEVLP